MAKIINISEVIGTPNAIIQKFGENFYNEVYPLFKSDSPIVIDFNGLSNLTSGFCNASIGRLFSEDFEKASMLISFNSLSDNPIWVEKVSDAIELAKNPSKSKQIDVAISSLFE
jgi:hypothetical protein